MNIYTTVDSAVGELLLVGEESPTARGGVALRSVSFADTAAAVDPAWRRDAAAFGEVERQLRDYFAGDRTAFELDHAPRGTAFQQRVWAAVEAIPYGATASYGSVAEQIGAPRERVRAVGAAVGANPLLIVRPCHRVVGADGSLTGYAGGVPRKRELLTHEGALQPQLI
jgi:methylated-DNA-[protein]-cysteine S-methyltransferase